MSGKIDTKSCIGPKHRAFVRENLRKGDKARIANILGTSADYVKDVVGRRAESATSVLAERVWLVGYRLLKQRKELSEEFNPQEEVAQ